MWFFFYITTFILNEIYRNSDIKVIFRIVLCLHSFWCVREGLGCAALYVEWCIYWHLRHCGLETWNHELMSGCVQQWSWKELETICFRMELYQCSKSCHPWVPFDWKNVLWTPSFFLLTLAYYSKKTIKKYLDNTVYCTNQHWEQRIRNQCQAHSFISMIH